MKNLWFDREARSFARRYAKQRVNRDRALRVYTSRLLGGEPALVLHGGGNTSVKTIMKDHMGQDTEVLCVKGSGRDMAAIEPEGLPAVRLGPLREMAGLKRLSDADMVNAQRVNMLDSTAPNPSVETLLHAFLPHKFIDHTHANAVLSLTNQKDGEKLCRRVFGKRMGLVPYIMPGFDLSRKALEVYEADPSVEGLIVLKHGIFTFGDTAKQAYSRMIGMVTLAERRLKKGRKKVFAAGKPPKRPKRIAPVHDVAPVLRGLVAAVGPRLVMDFRAAPHVRDFVNGRDLGRYGRQGTATPDHVIRTGAHPLIAPAPEMGGLDAFRKGTQRALARFVSDSHANFKRHKRRRKTRKTEIDPVARVILVPGLGLFGLGESAPDAAIAADIAETTIAVIAGAEAVGAYESIPAADMFDAEYWPLERAKLGDGGRGTLLGHVVAVTGAAGGIGAATVRAFAAEGAAVAVLDRDVRAARAVAAEIGGLGIGCDVTDGRAVRRAFDRVVKAYGGIDIVVSNAGGAWQGTIGEVSDKILRDSFELNFFAHQAVAKNAVRIMEAQGAGGCLLFNASKQAVNPGRDFGPYGLPKAAALALMRQYALDYGDQGIRSNAVNADRIRSGLLTGDMVKARARARGVSQAEYMSGNLLRQEVTAEDVARAFVDLALSPKTTAAVLTVDGGNIAAALR